MPAFLPHKVRFLQSLLIVLTLSLAACGGSGGETSVVVSDSGGGGDTGGGDTGGGDTGGGSTPTLLWSAPATWSAMGLPVPEAGDDVTIPAGETVIMDIDGADLNLGSLTVLGELIIGTTGTGASSFGGIGAAEVIGNNYGIVAVNITIGNGGSIVFSDQSGGILVSGTLTIASGGLLDFGSQSGDIETVNLVVSGILNFGSGTSGAALSATGDTTVTGTINLGSQTIEIEVNNATVSGNFLTDGGTANLYISGTWSLDGGSQTSGVTIVNQAPTIEFAQASFSLPFGFEAADFDYTSPGDYATPADFEDDTADLTVEVVVTPAAINPLRPGTYTVTVSVTDTIGEETTDSYEVVVGTPVLELLGEELITVLPDVEFVDPGAQISNSAMNAIAAETAMIVTGLPGELSGGTPYTNGFYDVTYTYSYQNADGSDADDLVLTRTVNVTPVVADLKVLTRVNGVSPETVYFSAQDSRPVNDVDCTDFSGATGDSGEETLIACSTGQYFSYHFYFDDPDSGDFVFADAPAGAPAPNSKNHQVSGSPRAIHTFVCEGDTNTKWDGGTQSCHYEVGVRVQEPDGDFADAFIDVYIQPQHLVYTAENTYCVAADSDWSECPVDVPVSNLFTDSPIRNLGQADDVEMSGKRVLYKRRTDVSDTTEYSTVCVGYDDSHVRIDAFGSGAFDPVVNHVAVGVDRNCSDVPPDTAKAQAYPELTKDADGYLTQGWAFDVSVSNLRLGGIKSGMASTLFTMHNLDLDWSADGAKSSYVELTNASHFCGSANPDLDCSAVQLPYGIFVSDVRALAYPFDVPDINNPPANLPLVNIGCFNACGLINGGIVGTEVKTAREHNVRFMGSWGLVISNSWFRGNHIGGKGPKSRLTLRNMQPDTAASKTANPEDFVDGYHNGTGPGFRRPDTAAFSEMYTSSYNFVVDTWFNDETMDPDHDSAPMVDFWSGQRHSGAFGSTVFFSPDDNAPYQFFLGGTDIVVLDTTFDGTTNECVRNNENGPPHSTDSFYHNQNRIWVLENDGSGVCGSGDVIEMPPLPPEPGQPGS